MKEISLKELSTSLDCCIKNVIIDDEFLKVSADCGNAVIISEAEWNTLKELAGIVLKSNGQL